VIRRLPASRKFVRPAIQAPFCRIIGVDRSCRNRRRQLLDLTVKAMRLRASVGEVSDALEKIFGRFRANNQTISGVYGGVVEGMESWESIKADIVKFAEEEGRRPRIMIAKLGQDGHDRGAKVVATAFADLGFDIDMGPLFQTPEEAARQAIENDVHAIGVSSLAAGHKTLLPTGQVAEGSGRHDIIVFAGGVIPAQDYDYLYNAGAKAIFGPGTRIEDSAIKVLEEIRKARG
jgi:methylmalonyl-CoA mutase